MSTHCWRGGLFLGTSSRCSKPDILLIPTKDINTCSCVDWSLEMNGINWSTETVIPLLGIGFSWKLRNKNDQGKIDAHELQTICNAVTLSQDKANDLMSPIDRDQPPPWEYSIRHLFAILQDWFYFSHYRFFIILLLLPAMFLSVPSWSTLTCFSNQLQVDLNGQYGWMTLGVSTFSPNHGFGVR